MAKYVTDLPDHRVLAAADLTRDARAVGEGRSLVQRQDSLNDQLQDLHAVALRFGLRDAADWLMNMKRMPVSSLNKAVRKAMFDRDTREE